MFITVEVLEQFAQHLAPLAMALGIVILLDLILGVTVAIVDKTFKWEKLADFLASYAPKVIGWLSVEVLGLLPTEYLAIANIQSGFAYTVYGILFLSVVASILGHLQKLGVVPDLGRESLPPTGEDSPYG